MQPMQRKPVETNMDSIDERSKDGKDERRKTSEGG